MTLIPKTCACWVTASRRSSVSLKRDPPQRIVVSWGVRWKPNGVIEIQLVPSSFSKANDSAEPSEL